MVSGGVGIAPFLSILRARSAGEHELYAFEAKDRPLHCKQELGEFQKGSQSLVNVIEGIPAKAHFAKFAKKADKRPILISGPEVFVTAVASALTAAGVNPARFRFEAFYPKYEAGNEILAIFENISDTGRVTVKKESNAHIDTKNNFNSEILKEQVVTKYFETTFLFTVIFFAVVLFIEYLWQYHSVSWLMLGVLVVFSYFTFFGRKLLQPGQSEKIIVFMCFLSLVATRLIPSTANLLEPWYIVFPVISRKLLKPNHALWTSLGFIAVMIGVSQISRYGYMGIPRMEDSLIQFSLAMLFLTAITQVFSRREAMFEKMLEHKESNQDILLAEMEESLKLSEMFIQISEQTSNHVILTDHNGRVLYANKAAERLTGYSFKEMRWQTPRLWGGLMSKEYYQELWERKSRGEVVTHELTNRRRDGSLYTALGRVTPIMRDQRVVAYVATEEDITHLKDIDRAKSEFVSLASHQLRTPLSAINWYAEMLLDGDAGKLSQEQEKYVKEVYTGNQRMVDLVNALLNVSRLDLGTFMIEPTPVNVVEIAESVIKELNPLIQQKQISIKQDFDSNLPKFQADAKLLRMVLQNLLSNAVKYSLDKGVVTATIKVMSNNTVFGDKRISGKALSIFVGDTGMGIPLQQQSKIFSKLFRADNAMETETEGTGLGLYIVKSIVDQSGGKIWFTSEQNKGTEFYVTFPLSGMKAKEGSKKLD